MTAAPAAHNEEEEVVDNDEDDYDEYEVDLPKNPQGCTFFFFENHQGRPAFRKFDRFHPDGSPCESERQRLIRNRGDVFVQVNGISLRSTPYPQARRILKRCFRTSLSVHLRLQDCGGLIRLCSAHNDDGGGGQSKPVLPPSNQPHLPPGQAAAQQRFITSNTSSYNMDPRRCVKNGDSLRFLQNSMSCQKMLSLEEQLKIIHFSGHKNMDKDANVVDQSLENSNRVNTTTPICGCFLNTADQRKSNVAATITPATVVLRYTRQGQAAADGWKPEAPAYTYNVEQEHLFDDSFSSTEQTKDCISWADFSVETMTDGVDDDYTASSSSSIDNDNDPSTPMLEEALSLTRNLRALLLSQDNDDDDDKNDKKEWKDTIERMSLMMDQTHFTILPARTNSRRPSANQSPILLDDALALTRSLSYLIKEEGRDWKDTIEAMSDLMDQSTMEWGSPTLISPTNQQQRHRAVVTSNNTLASTASLDDDDDGSVNNEIIGNNSTTNDYLCMADAAFHQQLLNQVLALKRAVIKLEGQLTEHYREALMASPSFHPPIMTAK
ncbi:hypothetical protein ACA910_008914 [Epithemia clementina (nom. ined.)]